MDDEDEINIKLELSKDKSQNLSIVTYFNENSSNFFKDGDYYKWKPTLKEKEFIIDAFELIINSNKEKNINKKIFKFSDKISKDLTNIEQSEKTNFKQKENNEDINLQIYNKSKEKQDIPSSNQENIINQTINNNLRNENNLSEYERERKIEKILRENKKK